MLIKKISVSPFNVVQNKNLVLFRMLLSCHVRASDRWLWVWIVLLFFFVFCSLPWDFIRWFFLQLFHSFLLVFIFPYFTLFIVVNILLFTKFFTKFFSLFILFFSLLKSLLHFLIFIYWNFFPILSVYFHS